MPEPGARKGQQKIVHERNERPQNLSTTTKMIEGEAANKTVFIVGVPRSGTTWTMMLLEQHPRVAVLQQSGLLHALQPLHKWWRSRGGYGKRVISSAKTSDGPGASTERRELFVGDLLDADELNAFCRRVLQYVYDGVRRSTAGATVVVDQTPENLEFAEWILELMPDAWFLHVVRDPRAVFASMHAANATWAKRAFPNQPEAVGTVWRDYAERIRDLKQRTDRIKEVRYEDLVNDGHAQLSSIFSWLQLEFDDAAVETALQNCSMEKLRHGPVAPPAFLRKGSAGGWQNEVSQGQRACVEYTAHPFMAAYNYPVSSSRPERAPLPLRIRRSLRRIVGRVLDRLRPGLKWARN
jgi:hypothetical protein